MSKFRSRHRWFAQCSRNASSSVSLSDSLSAPANGLHERRLHASSSADDKTSAISRADKLRISDHCSRYDRERGCCSDRRARFRRARSMMGAGFCSTARAMARCSHKFRASLRFILGNLGGVRFRQTRSPSVYSNRDACGYFSSKTLTSAFINWRFWVRAAGWPHAEPVLPECFHMPTSTDGDCPERISVRY